MTPQKPRRGLYIGIAAIVIVIIAVAAVYLSMPQGPATTSSTPTNSYFSSLAGSNEVPKATGSTGTATATYVISADGSTIHFVLTVTNVANITAAHIHFGNASVSGPVIVPLYIGAKINGPFTGILAQGNITASSISLGGSPSVQNMAQLIAAIKGGQTYTNVHTTAWPAGEIRGQIHP